MAYYCFDCDSLVPWLSLHLMRCPEAPGPGGEPSIIEIRREE